MMRKSIPLFFVLFCTICFSVSAQTAADTLKQYAGKWVGTYAGDVSGKCELTLSPGTDGRLTGQIVSSPSGGDSFTVSFKSITVQGSAFKADYIIPNANEIQVKMEASRSGEKLNGLWRVSTDEAKGTWEVTKVP